MVILASEIGKQSSHLALFSHRRDQGSNKNVLDTLLVSQSFSTPDYKTSGGIPKMIEEFLQSHPNQEDIYGVCLSIAGPIDNAEARIDIDGFPLSFRDSDLRNKLAYKSIPISFLNDMEAIGYSLFLEKTDDSLEVISPGEPTSDSTANKVLILVSDGLGQAIWHHCEGDQQGLKPIPSEGGHADFAPQTEIEIELLRFLQNNKSDSSRISYEYVISKKGLLKIYNFYRERHQGSPEFQQVEEIIQSAKNNSFAAQESLKLFASILGAYAGNLALTYKADGGVYLGGIPDLSEILRQDNKFLEQFSNKELTFGEYNKKIPVKVYSDPDIALWGAARYAVESGFVTKGQFAIMRSNQ